jgi:hypothetical protein
MNHKLKLWPFVAMLVLTIGYGSFYIYTLSWAYTYLTQNGNRLPTYAYIGVLWIFILISQTAFYWFTRARLTNLLWARIHILATYTAYVSFLLIPPVAGYFFEKYYGGKEMYYYSHLVSNFRIYSFYLLLITGNAFFVSIVVRAVKHKKISNRNNEQPSGILDGISNEH